ncbi:hypothetical protein AV521_00645 [Streptomyces sp. IMTB 2501]|uniref:hypothetical protein n=1 Tax=Streptomyces sp. IMTB 2501 TaxID=1776340 RepID=UPI00096D9B1B|nr:hypothetical protein [Streptomyces sp. IMTB 2501]OLZ74241.1 hypothetical protein AV521_00645 [Streptomyces sp. IMTB 2501]
MPKPNLTSWGKREVVAPKTMMDRITTPQKYYGKMPYFSARGCASNTTNPRSGMALYKGQFVDVLWPAAKVKNFGFTTSPDGKYFIVPEDGIYHMHFQAATYGDKNRTTGNNINVYIEAENNAAGNGAIGELGVVIQQHVTTNYYHSTPVGVTEFLTKGTKLKAKVYLDGGAEGHWVISDGAVDTSFHVFMVAPSSEGWHYATPGPAPTMKPWADDEGLDEQRMNEQTTSQFNALENRARVTGRGVAFNWKGQREDKNAVTWAGIYRNSTRPGWLQEAEADPGWGAKTAVEIPWDGIYLVSVIGNARHSAQPIANVQYIYQVAIYDSGGAAAKPILLSQGGNARTDHESGQLISDVVFLKAGTKLNVRFWGANSATNWDSGRDGGSLGSPRWWNFAVTYLGRGTYGSGG